MPISMLDAVPAGLFAGAWIGAPCPFERALSFVRKLTADSGEPGVGVVLLPPATSAGGKPSPRWSSFAGTSLLVFGVSRP